MKESEIPCKNCLVFGQCRMRLHKNSSGVTGLAIREDCKELAKFLYFYKDYDQGVNLVREIFGLRRIAAAIGKRKMKILLEKEQHVFILEGDEADED